MADSKKTVFQNPIFWVAVGGIGLAYYMYSKKAVATSPANNPASVASQSGNQAQTNPNAGGINPANLSPEQIFNESADALGGGLKDHFTNVLV